MREVVLDTETTGLDPTNGHRIIEVGAVELVNHMPTGRTYQAYFNPEREIPEEAVSIHGITEDFLADKPVFATLADELVAFIDEARLVIHNADFDMRFLNVELVRAGRSPISEERAIDTVSLARRKFPGAPASLDALCRRFQIDLSDRALHGALKDARLLSEVYLELIGGRQPGLALAAQGTRAKAAEDPRHLRPPRPHDATPSEEAEHERFLEKISDPIWKT